MNTTRQRRKAASGRKRRNDNGGRYTGNDLAASGRVPVSRVHQFSRLWNVGALSKTALDQGNVRLFSLSSIPNSSEFTALFDMYRIDRVELEYQLISEIIGSAYPRIAFTPDYNDSTPPTTESQILEYGSSEMFLFSQYKPVFRRTLKPRAQLGTYQGAFTAYSMAPPGTWISCDYPGVLYYGAKDFISSYNSTTFPNTIIQLYVRVHLSFKNSK